MPVGFAPPVAPRKVHDEHEVEEVRAADSAVCLLIDSTHSGDVCVCIYQHRINASQDRNLCLITPHFAYQFLVDFVVRERVYDHRTQLVEIETVPANAMHESFDAFVAHALEEFLFYRQACIWRVRV